MPIKVSKSSFHSALQKLAEMRKASPSQLNLRQIVDQSFSILKRLRDRGFTWEEIASSLEEAFEEEVKIKPKTLRYYYCQAASKKQKKSTASKKPRGATQVDKGVISEPTKVPARDEHQGRSKSTIAETSSPEVPVTSISEVEEKAFDLEEHFASIPEISPKATLSEASSKSDAISGNSGWVNGEWIEPNFNINRVRPKRNRTTS